MRMLLLIAVMFTGLLLPSSDASAGWGLGRRGYYVGPENYRRPYYYNNYGYRPYARSYDYNYGYRPYSYNYGRSYYYPRVGAYYYGPAVRWY